MNSFLRLVPEAAGLTIPACDGKATLAQATDVFTNHIDADFAHWRLDVAGQATPETSVAIYELTKDATFGLMFGSISKEIIKLCLTQAQIIAFVKQYHFRLQQDDYAILFLFQVNGEFFVAEVDLKGDGSDVDVYEFKGDLNRRSNLGFRVVVPNW